MTDRRRALLVAALAALCVRNLDAPELRHVHALLDSWRGIGLVVVGMQRAAWTAVTRSGEPTGQPLRR